MERFWVVGWVVWLHGSLWRSGRFSWKENEEATHGGMGQEKRKPAPPLMIIDEGEVMEMGCVFMSHFISMKSDVTAHICLPSAVWVRLGVTQEKFLSCSE